MAFRTLKIDSLGVLATNAGIRSATVTLDERVAAIYEEMRGEIFRYLVLTGLCPDQAQEVCQEAFLRLYSALRQGQKIENLRGWVFTVARNCAVHERAVSAVWGSLDPAVEEQLATTAASPERALLDQEKLTRLHKAWSSLSEQQRHCLHLRLEGFRYREIAEISGIGTSTVGELLRRGINRLRKALYD